MWNDVPQAVIAILVHCNGGCPDIPGTERHPAQQQLPRTPATASSTMEVVVAAGHNADHNHQYR